MAIWYVDCGISPEDESDAYDGGFGSGKLRDAIADITLANDDYLYLRSGATFTEELEINEITGITVDVYGGTDKAVIDGGDTRDNCVDAINATNLTASNIYVKRAVQTGFRIRNPASGETLITGYSGIKVIDCEASDNARFGFYVDNDNTPPSSDITFIRCYAHHNGAIGFDTFNAVTGPIRWVDCVSEYNGSLENGGNFYCHSARQSIDSSWTKINGVDEYQKSLSNFGGASGAVESAPMAGQLGNAVVGVKESLALGTAGSLTQGQYAVAYLSGQWRVRVRLTDDVNPNDWNGEGGQVEFEFVYCPCKFEYVNCVSRYAKAPEGDTLHGRGFSADGSACDVTYVGCYSEYEDGRGFHVNSGKRVKIHGCIVRSPGQNSELTVAAKTGVHVGELSQDIQVVNVTVIDNNSGSPDFRFDHDGNGVGTEIIDNLLSVNSSSYSVYASTDATGALTIAKMCSYSAADGVESDPGSRLTITSAATEDPVLSEDYVLGNSTLETAGTWVAGVRLFDDLPAPLHPPIGAKCRRDFPGRRFGAGGGKL